MDDKKKNAGWRSNLLMPFLDKFSKLKLRMATVYLGWQEKEMWFNGSKWGLAVERKQCDTKIWGWYLPKMISENSVAWQEVVDKWIFIYPLLPLKIYYNTWEQKVTFFSKTSMNADCAIILPACYISAGKSRQLCSWASLTNGWRKRVQSFGVSDLRGKRRWAQKGPALFPAAILKCVAYCCFLKSRN